MVNTIFSLNIYKMEMLRNFRVFLIWAVAICGILFLGMMFYPAINAGNLLDTIEPIFESTMMKSVLAVFGADLSNLGNLMGFYVTYNSIYNILLGCIFAAVLAGNLLAREEADKTAEFLFTKPVSRLNIFISKSAVLLTYIAAMSVVFFFTSWVSMEVVKKDAFRQLDISNNDKELLIAQIEKQPDEIYEVFNLDNESFKEYSLAYAASLLQSNTTEMEQMDLDIEDMNILLERVGNSPELFFESVLESPEEYMSMFSMGSDQRDEFLHNVENERIEYYKMKDSFYNSPDIFLQFLNEKPALALDQFCDETGSMSDVVSVFALSGDFENRIFRKYNVEKLAVFCFYIFLLLTSVGCCVLFISLLIRRGASILGFAIGIVLLFYFLKSITEIAAGFSGTIRLIGLISPFSWIDMDINADDYSLIWWRAGLFVILSITSMVAASFRLGRKDILV